MAKAKDETVALTVRIASKLHRRFKVRVARDGTTMNKVATDLLERYVQGKIDVEGNDA